MRNIYNKYQNYSYFMNQPQHNYMNMYKNNTHYVSASNMNIELRDYGPQPFVVNIDEATKQNDTFRTALWTGDHLQLTLMSIPVGGEIGLESHPNLDQFIRIEEGQGLVKMGDQKDNLDFQKNVYDDYAFIIPAGKWHNLMNTGNKPIKLYSIYAPPQHPYGTVHLTKEAAEAEEHNTTNNSQKQKDSENNYGALAAKADDDLTLEDMLTYALQDEYLSRARYLIDIEKLGWQNPFINLVNAEENHISYLIPLFEKYNVAIPPDQARNYVKIPTNLKESCEAGGKGEIQKIEMYERFLKQNIPNDVRAVFTLLRDASQNHLQAFQRVLTFC